MAQRLKRFRTTLHSGVSIKVVLMLMGPMALQDVRMIINHAAFIGYMG